MASWEYGAQVRGLTFDALNASFRKTETDPANKLRLRSKTSVSLSLPETFSSSSGWEEILGLSGPRGLVLVASAHFTNSCPGGMRAYFYPPGGRNFGAASGVGSATKMSTSVIKTIAQNPQFSSSQLHC